MTGAPRTGADRSPAPARHREDAVSSLLAQLGAGVVDDGYQRKAAEREGARRSGGSPLRGPHFSWALAIGLLLVGLLFATAASVARAREPAAARARAALATEVRARTAAADATQAQAASLQLQIARQRRALVATESGDRAADDLVRLEVLTGAAPVRGPGVRVTVDDAPATRGSTGSTRAGTTSGDAGRVLDRDLQVVVNGLLAAGAEAVAVNGQRLTTLSAIRSAGSAILVDYRPMSPPYRVDAVGDGQDLATAFADGPAGRYLHGLSEGYGVRFQVTSQRRLDLASATGLTLYHARADVSEATPGASLEPRAPRTPRPSPAETSSSR